MKRRWVIDERGHGVADAREFADGARELVAAMETVREEVSFRLLGDPVGAPHGHTVRFRVTR